VFTVDEWIEFSDEEISKMDSKALAWWKIWKPILLSIADTLCDETVQLEPCNNELEAELAASELQDELDRDTCGYPTDEDKVHDL
jgi:hypothetical protein